MPFREVAKPNAASRRPLLDALLQYGPEILPADEATRTDARGRGNDLGTGQNAAAVGAARLKPVGDRVNPRPVNKASLGINVLESEPGMPGVLVTGFRADSKADDVGLEKGDLIVSLDRTLTLKIADIANFLAQCQPGQVVVARVLRGDQMTTMRIPLLGPVPNTKRAENDRGVQILPPPSLPQRELSQAMPQEGVLPFPNTQRSGQPTSSLDSQQYGMIVKPIQGVRGISIYGVVNGSSAAKAGLVPGDRVVSVDGKLAANCESLARQLQTRPAGDVVSLGVVRGETYLVKPLTLSSVIDASATSLVESKQGPAAQSSEKSETGKGVLGGLESVLEGLLGGATEKSTGGATNRQLGNSKQSAAADDRIDRSKLVKGLTNEDRAEATGKPVRRTSFEESVPKTPQDQTTDPPSLNVLPLPPQANLPLESVTRPPTGTPSVDGNDGSIKSQPTAAGLREQIHKLQQQLQILEKDAEKVTTPGTNRND